MADGTLLNIFERLKADLAPMRFADPVAYTYNPLAYAWESWRTYIERYARTSCEVMFLGMNPGPPGLSNPYEGGRA